MAALSSVSLSAVKRFAFAQSLAFCSNVGMTPKQKLIEALRRLCAAHGLDAVADKAGVSAENLQQIVKGTLLPKSKEPRGVGPTLQRKLSAAYPGWDGYSDVVVKIAERAARLDEKEQLLLLGIVDSMQPEPMVSTARAQPSTPTQPQ